MTKPRSKVCLQPPDHPLTGLGGPAIVSSGAARDLPPTGMRSIDRIRVRQHGQGRAAMIGAMRAADGHALTGQQSADQSAPDQEARRTTLVTPR